MEIVSPLIAPFPPQTVDWKDFQSFQTLLGCALHACQRWGGRGVSASGWGGCACVGVNLVGCRGGWQAHAQGWGTYERTGP